MVKEITGGVFGALTDLLLWQVYLVGASVGKTGPRGVSQAFQEADEMLQQLNHRTLVMAWHQLTKRSLISYKKRGNLYYPEITQFGKKRLDETVPIYQTKRPWDGRVYLVTYDVPEINHTKRDALRSFLTKLGCKLLQESVWLTPYNPRELINEFVKNNSVPGTIIVSDVGSNGGIGESTIQDLIVKLYKLESLNQRYETVISEAKNFTIPGKQLLINYLSILRDDPQLPFELLPQGWLGHEADKLYQKLMSKYIITDSRP